MYSSNTWQTAVAEQEREMDEEVRKMAAYCKSIYSLFLEEFPDTV